MHPILTDTKKHTLYLFVWGVVGVLAGFFLSSYNGLSPLYSVGFTLPMLLFSGEINLSAWYLCRVFPVDRTPVWKLLTAAAAGVLIVTSVWTLVGWGLMNGIEQFLHVALSPLPLTQTLSIIFVLGKPLFLMSMAVSYLLMAFERTKESERSAYEARLSAQNAELKALRMQIDPHFLFNSLNSISALTATNAEQARTMTTTLADFFRKSLSYGAKETIPLAEELSLLEHYLAIEKIRFGKRLTVSITTDPSATNDPVPPLILQPLVENAIKHGIADSLEGGTVSIVTQKKNGRLFITVENPRDDDAVSRKSGAGMGLQIVRQRLHSLHGSDGDLITEAAGERFRAVVFFPVRERS